jgi:SH3-like domain-containing protein
MRQRHTKIIVTLAALLLPVMAWALDYRSISVPRAVFYDAPSAQAKKLYVAHQFYPVEVIVNLGDWIKVRDMRGEFAWVDAKQLDSKRTVIVKVPQAEAHEAADPSTRLVFRAEQDVALELIENGANGWVKVRHRDGLMGYIQINQVWGL